MRKTYKKILREECGSAAPAATGGGVASTTAAGGSMSGYDLPLGVASRKKYESGDEFADSIVQEVGTKLFKKMKEAKQRKADWKSWLSEEDDEESAVLECCKKTRKGIILKEKFSNRMLFLKNK